MAGLSTTQSFADGDTVTAAKLNNIIANASIDDDAVTTAKIADDAVTLAQMANNSVDTAELVDDAVQNSKLETMAAKTVKANATNATANPTDVAVAANEVLVGTSNSLKNVSFADDFELDAADDTATKIIAAPSLINGKSTVAASNLDELLLYDQDATSVLKKTTAGSVVASLKATDTQSGSTELATAAELIGATASPANLVAGVTSAAPMLVKAYVEFTSTTSNGAQTITNSFNLTSLTRTSAGVYDIVFDTNLPSDKYVMVANGWKSSSPNFLLFGRITSRTATGAGCTVKFGQYDDIDTFHDATGIATLVFYGLTS